MATDMENQIGAACEAAFGAEGEHLGRVLAGVPGLCMKESHRGTLDVGQRQATLRMEPPQWIDVRLDLNIAPAPADAMRVNHWLPGNVRFARGPRGMQLVAHTQTDGIAHLSLSMAEIKLGFEDAAGADPAKYTDGILADVAEMSEQLEAALAGLPFGDDGLVHRESKDGQAEWELRPRFCSQPVPVLLDRLPHGVRLHRTLLAQVPPRHRGVIADQALRWNARYRFCRLAWCGEELVVETMLHEALVTAGWLATAAQALAVVGREVRDVVETLAEDALTARWYGTVFFARAGAVPAEGSFPSEKGGTNHVDGDGSDPQDHPA